MAERLRVTGLLKSYGSRAILRALSFVVEEGEVLALLGPSGCGKTTTLSLIAGLERPDGGEIAIAGTAVCGAKTWVPPHRREAGMVFQDQALWPHLGVAEHLAFVLQARGVARAERPARIAAQLEAVQLVGRDAAKPSELSGGERQRLAIARALVGQPQLLLLDEPCANLDAPLKAEFFALLARLRAAQRFAAVYVTHDAAEAFEVADRAAVLDGGRLIQCGTPRELCERPATIAAARIIAGALGGALLPGEIDAAGRVKTALGTISADGTEPPGPAGRRVALFVRTEDLRAGGVGELEAEVRVCRFDGRGWVVHCDAGGVLLRARAEAHVPEGAQVRLTVVRPPRLFPQADASERP